MPVNELSNTMDLTSTLFRAQALFRRFQRTIDAIDKKRNFPAPPVRQRKSINPEATQGSSAQSGRSSTTGQETSHGVSGKGQAKVEDDVKREGVSGKGKAKVEDNVKKEGVSGKGKSKVEDDGKKEEEKVISAELRGLLSKKIITVEKG